LPEIQAPWPHRGPRNCSAPRLVGRGTCFARRRRGLLGIDQRGSGVIVRDAEEVTMETLERLLTEEPVLDAPRRSRVHRGGAAIIGSGKVLRVLSRTNMSLDDAGGRDVSLSRMTGILKGREPDFDEVSVVAVEFSDCVAGAGIHRGHAVNTHPGGEKTFVA